MYNARICSIQIGSVKKGTLYFEKASALFAADATVAKDSMIEAQLLMTQGLLLFCAEEVRSHRLWYHDHHR